MKTKEQINILIAHYLKSYEDTKDFEEFRKDVFKIIYELERITPVTPSFSSFLFHVKLDCENMDRTNAGDVILSLEIFLKKIT